MFHNCSAISYANNDIKTVLSQPKFKFEKRSLSVRVWKRSLVFNSPEYRTWFANDLKKMRFPKKDQKDTILFNSKITIENIPAKAYADFIRCPRHFPLKLYKCGLQGLIIHIKKK